MNVLPPDPSRRRRAAPRQPASEQAASQRRRPRIVLLGMGGTIASSADSAAQLHDYKVSATIEDILAAVPQVQELADIRCEQVANVDSHEIDNAMLLTLARPGGQR